MIFQLVLPGINNDVVIDYPAGFRFTDPASLISLLLDYIFPIAGLILFFRLIMVGFQLLTAAGNEEKISQAHKQLTQTVIGFVIIFVSFWLVKLIEAIFGVKIF